MAADGDKQILVDGYPFPTKTSLRVAKSARKQIIACVQHKKQLLADYRSAVRNQDQDLQRLLADQLVSDHQSIIAYTVQANRALPFAARIPIEDCLVVPAWMSLKGPLEEPAFAWAIPKPNGKYRTMVKFGPRHKAMQFMAQDILSTHFVPRPFQFSHSGVHRAIAAVRHGAKVQPTHYAHLDIRNFYGSYKLELLQELPVPQGLVDYVVAGRHLKVKVDKKRSTKATTEAHTPYPTTSTIIGAARLGVPTGSISSPLIGSWSVSRLHWMNEDVALITYVDNFLLLGGSARKVDAAAKALIEAVGNLPGGIFVLEMKDAGQTAEPFSFLGHLICIQGSAVSVEPLKESVAAFMAKFDTLECELIELQSNGPMSGPDSNAALTKLASLRRLLDGWGGAFSQCDNIGSFLAPIREALEFWMDAFHISKTALEVAAKHCPNVIHFDFSGLPVVHSREKRSGIT